MARLRHLNNAPVREALFDFQAILRPDFLATAFSSLGDQLAAQLPVVEEHWMVETHVETTGGRATVRTGTERLQGLFFKTTDQLTVAQFRLNGFTFNRLAPYTTWEELLPEALRLWTIYSETAQPESVPRIAVRYINDLRLRRGERLEQFLARPPQPPPGVPSELTRLFLKTESRDVDSGISVNLSQAIQPGVISDERSLLLDVDVYRLEEFRDRLDEIPPAFETLRAMKNRVFFENITEEAAHRYE